LRLPCSALCETNPPPWYLTRRRHDKHNDDQRTNHKGAAAGAAEARAPTLIVFGGRGFVGSAVCEEALNTGLEVVSISPSGAFGFVSGCIVCAGAATCES
jgi:hypothetical protein